MAVMLYYPLVNPPTEVVHQSLLYWDGIASVVPAAPEIRASAVSRELRELEEQELYTPVVLSSHVLPSFGMPDIDDVVRQPGRPSNVLLEELDRLAARPQPPRPTSPPEAFLYLTKTNFWLEGQLRRRGLSVDFPDFTRRISVSREVRDLVIGVAVREIAEGAGRAYFPYTDSVSAHGTALRPARRSRALAWEMELGRLLPVPAPGTPTADVLAFRERYADERLRLMRAVHRLLGELRRDYEHPVDVFAQLRLELDRAAADYGAAVRSSRTAWVHRSVSVTVALAAAAGGALLLPDLEWLLGVVGGYMLNVATREIRPSNRGKGADDFCYLHRVRTGLS